MLAPYVSFPVLSSPNCFPLQRFPLQLFACPLVASSLGQMFTVMTLGLCVLKLELTFRARKKKYAEPRVQIRSSGVPQIIQAMLESIRDISVGFSEFAAVRQDIAEASRLPLEPREPGPGHGILEQYMAYSNYHKVKPSRELHRFIQDKNMLTGSSDLNLSDCPGIEPKSTISYVSCCIPYKFPSLAPIYSLILSHSLLSKLGPTFFCFGLPLKLFLDWI